MTLFFGYRHLTVNVPALAARFKNLDNGYICTLPLLCEDSGEAENKQTNKAGTAES